MWNNIRKLAHHRRGKWKGFVSKQNVLKAKPFVCDCWYGVCCQIWGLRARILQWFLPRIAWIDDSCHDRPSEVFSLAVAVSKLRFRLRLRLHGVLHNMPSPMAVGSCLAPKSAYFGCLLFYYPLIGFPTFQTGQKMVTANGGICCDCGVMEKKKWWLEV